MNQVSLPLRHWLGAITFTLVLEPAINWYTVDCGGGNTLLLLGAPGVDHSGGTGPAGRVGVNTSSPWVQLHIFDNSAGINFNRNGLLIEDAASAQLTLVNNGTGTSFVAFSGPTGSGGSLNYDNRANACIVKTSDLERVRIDATGHLGVGTTTPQMRLHVASGTALGGTPSAVTVGYLRIDESSFYSMLFDQNQIQPILNAGSTANLALCAIGGSVGIGTASPGTFELAVNGTAANSTGSWSVFSDERLKRNALPLEPGTTLDQLLSLRGVNFEYTNEAVKIRNLPAGRRTGFIAQGVERVFPCWVSADDQGYKYITEQGTTALMVEALRDLRAEKDAALADKQVQIDGLKAENSAAQRELDGLKVRPERMEHLLETTN